MRMLPSPPHFEPAPIRYLGELVSWIIVGIAIVMIGLVFTNVVTHLFHKDIPWTTEFCEFLMVWVSFLGGAAATRHNAHMRITELVDQLPPRFQRWSDVFVQLVTATILGLLIWYGIGIVNSTWGNVMTVLGWPMALQYMALPVGSAVALTFVAFNVSQIRQRVNHGQDASMKDAAC